MPWDRIVERRLKFVLAAESGDEPFVALCEREGISRTTGYKWWGRYQAEGPTGLLDRSSAPGSAQPLGADAARAAGPRLGGYKGWVRLGDGSRCEPLTITDGFCRFLRSAAKGPSVRSCVEA